MILSLLHFIFWLLTIPFYLESYLHYIKYSSSDCSGAMTYEQYIDVINSCPYDAFSSSPVGLGYVSYTCAFRTSPTPASNTLGYYVRPWYTYADATCQQQPYIYQITKTNICYQIIFNGTMLWVKTQYQGIVSGVMYTTNNVYTNNQCAGSYVYQGPISVPIDCTAAYTSNTYINSAYFYTTSEPSLTVDLTKGFGTILTYNSTSSCGGKVIQSQTFKNGCFQNQDPTTKTYYGQLMSCNGKLHLLLIFFSCKIILF